MRSIAMSPYVGLGVEVDRFLKQQTDNIDHAVFTVDHASRGHELHELLSFCRNILSGEINENNIRSHSSLADEFLFQVAYTISTAFSSSVAKAWDQAELYYQQSGLAAFKIAIFTIFHAQETQSRMELDTQLRVSH